MPWSTMVTANRTNRVKICALSPHGVRSGTSRRAVEAVRDLVQVVLEQA